MVGTFGKFSKNFPEAIDFFAKRVIIINVLDSIAGLCNGSTPDSDSVCEGSNPSPAAKRKGWQISVGICQLFAFFAEIP